MNNKIYDKGDYCLRASLHYAGRIMVGESILRASFLDMVHECKLESFHPIKSKEYTWSTSGSENEKENTLFKRPTYWLWKNVLKHFNMDPHKGLNSDQLRAFFIVMYLRKDIPIMRKIWWKTFFGFILRLGLTPSLMEWAPLKPQAYVLFWKSGPRIFWPIYKICEMVFTYRYYNEIENVPIYKSTTNKISAIPTAMLLLGYERPSNNFIKKTYQEYFKGDIVGESIKEGVLSYEFNRGA